MQASMKLYATSHSPNSWTIGNGGNLHFPAPLPRSHVAGAGLRLHPPQQFERTGLGERLIEVPAFGRLNARRAARAAWALSDQSAGVCGQALELIESPPCEAHSTRVAVIDEDRGPAGLRMGVGREPTDVPAIAHRDQGQDRDLGMLERM